MKPMHVFGHDYYTWSDSKFRRNEEEIARIAIDLFNYGYSEMHVYRILGLSTEGHWTWLRGVKLSLL
jgi:hypothetical protein